jgi:hypothetical protein
MTEKQFEDFLTDAAREYNAPPDTPRDAMWARIAEAREARGTTPRMLFRVSPPVRWGLGLAATLVLGIGIGMNLDRFGGAPAPSGMAAATGTGAAAGQDRSAIYQLVAADHLSQVEAFLTMFRADVRAGRTDTEVVSPARELLTATRLLQGSPAGQNARLRELLDDLELVLVQIAQIRGEQQTEETDLVTEAIDERSVILRLRAAANFGPELRGVQGVL